MDIRKIKNLLDLLEGSTATEIEIKNNDETIRISRQKPAVEYVPQAVNIPPPPIAVQDSAQDSVQDSAKTEAPKAAPPVGNLVKSPMVGSYYSAPSPNDKDYVEIGDTVKVGDTLCIVEAMKIMNPIKSEFSGKVIEKLLTSGDAVEYDQVLFVIE